MGIQEHDADTLTAVERFNLAFNRHDINAIMDAMTEDCICENASPAPDGTLLEGPLAVRAYLEKFFAANPDAFLEAEEIFVAGDRCVVRWIYRKTIEGKAWHLRGVDIFKVKHGKIAGKLAYVKG